MIIYKYPLQVTDLQGLWMPTGAQLLTVQVQGVQPTLWAAVDPRALEVVRRVVCLGTGNPFPSPDLGRFLGTTQLPPFVWHWFDAGEVS